MPELHLKETQGEDFIDKQNWMVALEEETAKKPLISISARLKIDLSSLFIIVYLPNANNNCPFLVIFQVAADQEW